MRTLGAVALALLLLAPTVAESEARPSDIAAARTSPRACHPLVPTSGPTFRLNATQARSLPAVVSRAPRGATILLADGTYCYTGGIDAHGARGWIVRLNRFDDIRCGKGLAEHAVHFWTGSRDTLVERNTIVDCARGIGFGLGERTDWARRYPDLGAAGYVGHYGGIIRNNVVVALRPGMDTGIGLEQARGARVYHNTVYAASRASGYFSSLGLPLLEHDGRHPEQPGDEVHRPRRREGEAGSKRRVGAVEVVPQLRTWARTKPPRRRR